MSENARYLFGAELEVEAYNLADALRIIGVAIVNAADHEKEGLGPVKGSWYVARAEAGGYPNVDELRAALEEEK